MSELHILNGDFAFKLWQQCDFKAQSLIWRETYLDGPLPDSDDLHLFRQVRAGYLATFAELTGIDAERLYKHLLKMDEALQTLPENATVMLWFDSCIFDQTLLMRILYLLHIASKTSANIHLYCCPSNCLTLNDFQVTMDKKIQLAPQDLALAARAWKLFVCKDASGMKELAAAGNFEHLPAMQRALLRCAEDVPGPDGLNRTRRQILQLVADGCRTFEEIFRNTDKFEEYPFLGDTACQRHLDYLSANGFLTFEKGKYFTKQENKNE